MPTKKAATAGGAGGDDASPPPPQKIVHYPIHGDLNGGTLLVLGDRNSPRLVFMMAGFPDDHQAFLDLATGLARQGCLVGVTCLPGYDRTEPWLKHPRGFTLEEVVAATGSGMLALAAQSLRDVHERRLTCVFHDWGCVFGSIQANRVLLEDVPSIHPRQLVLFDVCGPPHPEARRQMVAAGAADRPRLGNTLRMLTYQAFFAACFAVQTHVSPALADVVYRVGSVALFGVLGLSPVGPRDAAILAQPLPRRKLVWMMYPYYHAFTRGRDVFREFHLPAPDAMRVLYMYGTEKKVMFHTPLTLQYFAEQDPQQARAEAVEETGHWLYLQKPDYCLRQVIAFCFGDSE